MRFPLACFEVTDADFSGLKIESGGQLGPYSRFVNCRFDRTEKPANLRDEFVHCSFDRANLNRAVLGNLFEECTFRAANLQSSLASRAIFGGCLFTGGDLRHVKWYDCRFERCRFEDCKFDKGSVAGAIFDRCEIDRDALAQADVLVERVQFVG